MSELTSSRAEPLRAEYERVYGQRVLYMQKFYEMKQETLHDAIQQVYTAVLQDDLLKTLKKDATTAEFILERVRELFEEIVTSERELLIERLGQQLTQIRSQCSKLEQENGRLGEAANNLNGQLQARQLAIEALEGKLKDEQATKRTENQSIMLTTEREVGELRKSLSVLESECDHLRTIIKEREQGLKVAQSQLDELQRRNEQSERRCRQLEGECQDLRKLNIDEVRNRGDTSKQVSILERKIREMETNSAELEEMLRRHYKEKSAEYKSKIEKYKEKVNELTKTLSRGDKQKLLLAKSLEELEGKIATIIHENDTKFTQYRNQRDRERVELERKHDWQMKQSQMHYERLLEAKIKEVEAQAQNSLAVLQELEKEFRGQITTRAEDYENNYVRRERYETVMNEKDELLSIVRAKLEEREAENKELNARVSQLFLERDQAIRETRQAVSVIEQHEQVFTEMNDRKRQLEAKIEQMLSAEKKTRRLSVEFENRLAVLTNEKEEKERKLAKKSSKYVALETQAKDLKVRYEQLESSLEAKIKSLVELQEQIKKVTSEKDQKQLVIVAEQKQAVISLSELTSKHEAQRRDYEQLIEKSKGEIDSLKLQLEVSREVDTKYQQECQSHRETMQKLSVTEKELQCERMLQAANQEKFKEALAGHMEQVEQAKQIIDKLSREYKGKSEQSDILAKSASAMQQRLEKVEPALARYKKVVKVSSSSLESLTREISSLKDYISNIRRVYYDEMGLWTSILQRDFEDILRAKDIEFIGLKKQLTQIQAAERSHNEERLRTEFNSMISEKANALASLKEELKEKQLELQQQQKSVVTSIQAQQELATKLRLANLKVDQLQQENANEKKNNAERLEQQRTRYEQDREKLVAQIEQKNSLYQNDFKDLDKALVTLKGECESLRDGLDRSKQSHHEELESMRRKRETLDSQLRSANEKIIEQDRTLSSLRADKESLQTDIRDLQKSKATDITGLTSRLKDLQAQIQSLSSDKLRLERDLEQSIKQSESLKTQLESTKSDNRRLNDEITQMNTIIGRTVRNTDNETLRMARHLDNQTKELTTKVKQLRRLSTYLGGRDPNTLRS